MPLPLLVDVSPMDTLMDDEFYESLDLYEPKARGFQDVAARHLPPKWTMSRKSIWCMCRPNDVRLPEQGWKIHVSSTPNDAPAVLSIATRLFVRQGTAFKFAIDEFILSLQNGKSWSRGGSGKFITGYPADAAKCRALLDLLCDSLCGYDGPYVLSDRRYKDSRVVHYRYGGFTPRKRLTARGERIHLLRMPGGRLVEDLRKPYFDLPEGVPDLVPDTTDDRDGSTMTLKDGRYVIESAISFSNSGGVYLGRDRRNDSQVVIKEARPFTSMTRNGLDAVALLRKEHRIHRLLEDANVAPRPLDFFRDWEHYYFVQEFIAGTNLRHHMATRHVTIRIRVGRADLRKFFGHYRRLYLKIALALQIMHERDVVFGDVSLANLMVSPDGEEIRFIDFEGAVETGVDLPRPLATPGFTSRRLTGLWTPTRADDCYGLGALMFAGMMPVNNALSLDGRAVERFLGAWRDDLGMPSEYAEVVRGLMHPDPERRWSVTAAIAALRRPREPEKRTGTRTGARRAAARESLRRTVDYILAHGSPDRLDRLVPADPGVFRTNGLNVAWGATGVAWCLKRIDGDVPAWMVEWIRRRLADGTVQDMTAGLYVGLSGVAWGLYEIGLIEEAMTLIDESHRRLESIAECPDLFYGVAGWGMANLKFHLRTGEQRFLDRAVDAGNRLVRARVVTDGGWAWSSFGQIGCSLGHGAAGVSLFLLYLYLATGDTAFRDAVWNGVRFIVSKARVTPDGGRSWLVYEEHVTHTPYHRWGSAGIGAVLLRYRAVHDDPVVEETLKHVVVDCDRKYAVFPGRFFGLSGIGDFAVDMMQFGYQTPRARRICRKVLDGVMLFAIEKRDGLAFPGEGGSRISCDFGTGGAGIATFMHRFLDDAGPAFMVDELIASAGDRKNGMAGSRLAPAMEQPVRRQRRPRISANAVSGDAAPAQGRGAA